LIFSETELREFEKLAQAERVTPAQLIHQTMVSLSEGDAMITDQLLEILQDAKDEAIQVCKESKSKGKPSADYEAGQVAGFEKALELLDRPTRV